MFQMSNKQYTSSFCVIYTLSFVLYVAPVCHLAILYRNEDVEKCYRNGSSWCNSNLEFLSQQIVANARPLHHGVDEIDSMLVEIKQYFLEEKWLWSYPYFTVILMPKTLFVKRSYFVTFDVIMPDFICLVSVNLCLLEKNWDLSSIVCSSCKTAMAFERKLNVQGIQHIFSCVSVHLNEQCLPILWWAFDAVTIPCLCVPHFCSIYTILSSLLHSLSKTSQWTDSNNIILSVVRSCKALTTGKINRIGSEHSAN